MIIPPYGIDPNYDWTNTSQEAVQKGHNNVFKFIIRNYVDEKPESQYHPFEFYIDTNGKSDTPVFNAFNGGIYDTIANNIKNSSSFNAFNFAETTTTVNFSGGPAILQIITGGSLTVVGNDLPFAYQFTPDLNFPKDVPYVQTTALLDFQQNSWLTSYLKNLYKKLFSPNPLYLLAITEGIDTP